MRQTTGTRKSLGEKLVKDIKRATRKQYSSEEKIRIILDGLRGEDSIAELCRCEGLRTLPHRIVYVADFDAIALNTATHFAFRPNEPELRPVFRTVCLLTLRGHFPSHIFESLFWRFVADA